MFSLPPGVVRRVRFADRWERARQAAPQPGAWEALQIADYDFDYALSCFCATEATQPVRVEVRGGVIAGVINRTAGERVPPQ
jgi:hypothetical protein